jgi:hypothetical protein
MEFLSSVFQGEEAVTVCSEAARACINIADIHRRRRPDNPLFFGQVRVGPILLSLADLTPFTQTAVFTSAMVLLLNTWDNSANVDDTSHVHTAIEVLRSHEDRCV